MPLPVPPFYVSLTNFNHYRENNHIFMSDPFYSHVGGYKMVMIIRPNGVGIWQGSHISLYIFLLPGEFDDQLCWPFNCRITVQAYNRTKEKWSLQQTIMVKNERRCVDAPIGGGAGCENFLSFSSLGHYSS